MRSVLAFILAWIRCAARRKIESMPPARKTPSAETADAKISSPATRPAGTAVERPTASRYHPSGILPERTRLTHEERCALAERLRTRADTEAGLTRSERAELRRKAQNVECVGRIIEQKYARFNRHPEHPTMQ